MSPTSITASLTKQSQSPIKNLLEYHCRSDPKLEMPTKRAKLSQLPRKPRMTPRRPRQRREASMMDHAPLIHKGREQVSDKTKAVSYATELSERNNDLSSRGAM